MEANTQDQDDSKQSDEIIEESTLEEYGIKSNCILEDDEYIYMVGLRQISKTSKTDNKTTILWENWNPEEEKGVFIYEMGSGILYNNKIYFLTTDGNLCSISTVSSDGTGYQELLGVESVYYGNRLFLENNILYIYEKSSLEGTGYRLKEDGSLDTQEEAFPCDMVLADGNYVIDFNSHFVLSSQYSFGEDEKTLYLTDRDTKVTETFTVCDNNMRVIAMDEEYLYTINNDAETGEYVYGKILIEGAESSELFRQKSLKDVPGVYGSPDNIMNLTVRNGCIYYPEAEDYKLYLVCRTLDNPTEAQKVGEPFYNTRISNLGKIESIHEELYSETQTDVVIYSNDILYLVLDDRFEGAGAINQTIVERECSGYEMEDWDKEYLESELEVFGSVSAYSYSSHPSRIYYFDENYFSFYQQSYIYTGGAHGMGVWVGYTFDLHSGKELGLSDVIGNSEDELKEIVTRYFAALINKDPGAYWDDAIETVTEWTDLNVYYYLTNEGIAFYFDPYALACYAAGFQQVIIPYSEFDMKIDLQTAKQ